MSWALTMIGTPAGVRSGLEAYGGSLTGQSAEEYETAKPHLVGLVDQVVGEKITLSASGHASFSDGVKTRGSLIVTLNTFYGQYLDDPDPAQGG